MTLSIILNKNLDSNGSVFTIVSKTSSTMSRIKTSCQHKNLKVTKFTDCGKLHLRRSRQSTSSTILLQFSIPRRTLLNHQRKEGGISGRKLVDHLTLMKLKMFFRFQLNFWKSFWCLSYLITERIPFVVLVFFLF